MPFLNEYYKIKKSVVNILVNDEEFVRLLTNSEPDDMPAKYLIEQLMDDGSLHYGQIHLYDFIPGETQTAESHVCIEVMENKMDTVFAGKFILQIDVFVPEELMNMYGNIRRDAIAARIDFLLNGQHIVLGQVERAGGGLAKPIQHWRQRVMRYQVTGWNRSYDEKTYDDYT